MRTDRRDEANSRLWGIFRKRLKTLGADRRIITSMHVATPTVGTNSSSSLSRFMQPADHNVSLSRLQKLNRNYNRPNLKDGNTNSTQGI